MSNSMNRRTCFIISCVVSALVALLVLLLIIQPVNFFTGLILFLIITAVLLLIPGTLFWPFGDDAEDNHTAAVAAEAARTAPAAKIPEAAPVVSPQETAPTAPQTAPSETSGDYDGDGVVEGKDEGNAPVKLDAPRDGKADNLKEIKGVGPKLEALLNSMGFYHFDQIAGWSAEEVAWVNANLEGFSGRVSRDNWVEQAKVLAAGGETEFSKRVGDGDVY